MNRKIILKGKDLIAMARVEGNKVYVKGAENEKVYAVINNKIYLMDFSGSFYVSPRDVQGIVVVDVDNNIVMKGGEADWTKVRSELLNLKKKQPQDEIILDNAKPVMATVKKQPQPTAPMPTAPTAPMPTTTEVPMPMMTGPLPEEIPDEMMENLPIDMPDEQLSGEEFPPNPLPHFVEDVPADDEYFPEATPYVPQETNSSAPYTLPEIVDIYGQPAGGNSSMSAQQQVDEIIRKKRMEEQQSQNNQQTTPIGLPQEMTVEDAGKYPPDSNFKLQVEEHLRKLDRERQLLQEEKKKFEEEKKREMARRRAEDERSRLEQMEIRTEEKKMRGDEKRFKMEQQEMQREKMQQGTQEESKEVLSGNFFPYANAHAAQTDGKAVEIIALMKEDGEDIRPFGGAYGMYRWKKLNRASSHLIVGEKDGEVILGVPGDFGLTPPNHLHEFREFAYSVNGIGYWLKKS